jgi:membrane associated rhomboid family serine protease
VSSSNAIGSLRLLVLFFAAGLGGAAMHCLVDPSSQLPLVGCSGALFGLLALAGALRPRLLGFVGAFVLINLWHAFAGGGGAVSFGCHLGGFLVGAVFVVSARLARSNLWEIA